MPLRRSTTSRRLLRRGTSELGSLVLFALLLLSSNWCFQRVKHSLQLERASAHSSSEEQALLDAPAGPADAAVSHAAGFLWSWGLGANHRLGRAGGGAAAPAVALPQLEVAQAAASRHSLALTAEGRVWSFGANDSCGGGGHGSTPLEASGQLGRATGGWAPGPVVAGGLAAVRVRSVAAGRYHSVAVDEDGRVWTFGLNDWGQLGRAVPATPAAAASGSACAGSGGAATHAQPQQQQADAAFTRDHRLPYHHHHLKRLAADQQGASSNASTCTSAWSCHAGTPGVVEALAHVRVVAAAAGRYSTLALDDSGGLWVWGLDGCGTEGRLPAQGAAWEPRLVEGALTGKRVTAFDAGYTFWLAATDDGQLWSCDNQDDGYAATLPTKREPNNAGQLGRAGAPHVPGRVLGALSDKSVVAVAVGREHAVVATSEGQVFSFGGARATLGRDGRGDQPGGVVTGALAGQRVTRVAAGEYYSLAATDTAVFGWGSNAYLSTGASPDKAADVLHPTAVSGPLSSGAWTIHSLAAGFQHAFAVASTADSATAASLRALSGGSQAASSIEVVLTEAQQAARQQAQQAGGDAATSPSAVETAEGPQQPQGEAANDGGPTSTDSSNQAASSDGGRRSKSSSSDSASGPDPHTHYLAAQPPPLQAPVQAVWAAWKPSPNHEQLAALSRDVFDALPAAYNSVHKNPCWGGEGPGLTCLPYFNIIGVSKCGTTDLYQRLMLYKDRLLPATNKGPHFWDECPFPAAAGGGGCQAGASGDFSGYISLFSRAADLIRRRRDAITGEASSNTFTSANSIWLRGFIGDQPLSQFGANVTLPALLREAQPYLRLILLLRDPADRYQSAFHYYRWWLNETQPPTPADFHQHALREVAAWRDCVATRAELDCLRSFKPQQLVKGMYAAFLPDWLRHWPPRQLLILRYEDYVASTSAHLSAVLRFLDVPQPDGATLAAMANAPVANKRTYEPMLPDTRQALRQFYAPFNARLAAALGGDARWTWPQQQEEGAD